MSGATATGANAFTSGPSWTTSCRYATVTNGYVRQTMTDKRIPSQAQLCETAKAVLLAFGLEESSGPPHAFPRRVYDAYIAVEAARADVTDEANLVAVLVDDLESEEAAGEALKAHAL